MSREQLPNLSPYQVVRVQDALLANADALLVSARAVLDLGHLSLARSLAILALEESGKAIAIHARRVEMAFEDEGADFTTEWLRKLWISHTKKLEAVYGFLVEEQYWFGVDPPDPHANEAALGAVEGWARRHNHEKQKGFYVDIGDDGEVNDPEAIDVDASTLRMIIGRIHQIGWQLRLGEHIEWRRQQDLADGVLGRPGDGSARPNLAYGFSPDSSERVGSKGYEAFTRELKALRDSYDP